MSVTVCALLYGEYPELAERCLRSIVGKLPLGGYELRVGMNAVCEQTRRWVRSWLPAEALTESETNLHKYPMMRRLFYDRPLVTDHVMWFDDDSFILDEAPVDWLATVEHQMEHADMLGAVYHMRLSGQQHRWIEAQSWFTGKPVTAGHVVRFITGGWWTIRAATLQQFDWPSQELDHNGGDVMLGELCRQQGLKLETFQQHIGINADTSGRCSSAARRGFSQNPIGYR